MIGQGADRSCAVSGTNVSRGEKTKRKGAGIKNAIGLSQSQSTKQVLKNSMIGNHVKVVDTPKSVSIGDYTQQTH